jgi:dienelactone hydrolase
MTYDPFKRGKYPVGVRTVDINGTKVEVWYPATDEYVGQDLDEKTMDRYTIAEGAAEQVQQAVRNALIRTEKFPIILQSHAAVGHRRDAAPTCTHLASHGYIVTSPEFVGDTTGDILHDATVGAAGEKRSLPMRDNLANRESVVVGTLNAILNGAAGKLTDHMDVETVGALGVSLGGWTTMRLLSLDRNVKAAVLTVPSSGTRGPFEDTKLQNSMLRLDDWGRAVPTFLLAGDRDALIPLDDMCEFVRESAAAKAIRNPGGCESLSLVRTGRGRLQHLPSDVGERNACGRRCRSVVAKFSAILGAVSE